MTEADLQITCVQYLDLILRQKGLNAYYLVREKKKNVEKEFLPHTISPIAKMSEWLAKRMRLMGYNRGTIDLTLFMPLRGYHALTVEFKKKKEVLKGGQLYWQNHLMKYNYKYALIYNFDDFKSLIDWYFG
jgi:hypothetical protein